ncbi:hypothetical protein C0995_005622 [Termitomyces sp. Mi166|nr:hypothetical protein C0995_005622 [Termitomyces sp. Mi166\
MSLLRRQETIAGLGIQQSYKPALSPQEFPTRNTRPPTTTDLDLAGLEDDPDFWNMDIGEEVLPVIRDLTRPKGDTTKPELPCARDLHSDKSRNKKDSSSPQKTKGGSLLHSLDREAIAPKRMQNGNFDCRDGLPEKPKRRPSAGRPVESPKKQQNRITTEITKPKASISSRRTKDSRLEQLESLHEQSNVSNNLQLSPGHRLKLESLVGLKRKRKPIPDFKINYTELKEPYRIRTGYDSIEMDDDDDLPETVGIDHSQTPPSETSYPNSDIDSLIRAIPLDDELLTTASGGLESETSDRRPLASSNKRKKTIEPNISNKRIRSEGLPDQSQWTNVSLATRPWINDPLCRLQRTTLLQKHLKDTNGVMNKHESLFLSDDINELEENLGCDEPSKVYDRPLGPPLLESDDPSLTSEYLDDATPDLTPSNSFKLSGILEVESASLVDKTLPRTDTYEKEENIDDFAELDAWLNSGAVEIL